MKMIFLINMNDITSILLETLQNSTRTIYVISEQVYIYLREHDVKVDMVYIKVDHIYFNNGYCVRSASLVGNIKLLYDLDEHVDVSLLLSNCDLISIDEYLEEEYADD